MNVPHREPKTPKAKATRQRIYAAAMGLFNERGYEGTTMRDVAQAAGVSLGLAYRYFGQKEEIVLALYEQLADQAAVEVTALPKGKLADRLPEAFRRNVIHLAPHRRTLGGLFGVGLSSTSELSVFGAKSATVRQRTWEAYHELVVGSTDCPGPVQTKQLTTLLFAGHLVFVLFWLLDKSEGQSASAALAALSQRLVRLVRPALALPIVAELLKDLDQILSPMFAPTAQDTSSGALHG